jgi:hypothetical protein
MPLSLNFEAAADKNQLVAGLATLLAVDCSNVDAATIDAIATASGNALPAGFAAVYAGIASKVEKSDLCPALGGGGGAAPAAGGAAPAAAAAPEKPKEEEVDALDGGMDMFGGGGGGGDY